MKQIVWRKWPLNVAIQAMSVVSWMYKIIFSDEFFQRRQFSHQIAKMSDIAMVLNDQHFPLVFNVLNKLNMPYSCTHVFFLHVLFKEWVCVSSILGTWCGKQTARQEAGYLTEVCRCNKLYVTINIFIHVFNLQKSRRKKSHCNLPLCCEGYLFIPSTAAAITIKLVCGRISSWL